MMKIPNLKSIINYQDMTTLCKPKDKKNEEEMLDAWLNNIDDFASNQIENLVNENGENTRKEITEIVNMEKEQAIQNILISDVFPYLFQNIFPLQLAYLNLMDKLDIHKKFLEGMMKNIKKYNLSQIVSNYMEQADEYIYKKQLS